MPDDGNPFNRQIARIAVGAYDDAQDVRTSLMNRIRDIVRKKNEGIPFDEVEGEKEDGDYDSKYSDENLADIVEEMTAEGKLTPTEHGYLVDMLEAARAAEKVEDRYKSVMQITKDEPIFTRWLTHVYGVSTTLTARLIHQFGYCEDFAKVSNLWSYSGLAPGQTRVRGEKLNYSPDAKTLAWLVADNMIKQGSRSQYRVEFYEPYKAKQMDRLRAVKGVEHAVCEIDTGDYRTPCTFDVSHLVETQEEADELTHTTIRSEGEMLFKGTPPESRGHADNRARRYLAKKFLKHFWWIARDLKGLETPDEWIVTHGGHDKSTETFENPAYARRQLVDA